MLEKDRHVQYGKDRGEQHGKDKKKCKRCGRSYLILSNGYCSRCDNTIFGKN